MKINFFANSNRLNDLNVIWFNYIEMQSLQVYIFTSLVVLKLSLGVEYDCLYAARIMTCASLFTNFLNFLC